MFGFRPEGRRVKDIDPIVQITPYLMPMRCDAQVFLDHEIEYETLMRYIAKKAREGVKITFMDIIIASFVRGVSQVPEINRFIMNKQFYNRKELTVSFTVLLNTTDDSIKENTVKVFFDPSDTIYDVSARCQRMIAANRDPEEGSFVIKLASALLKVPGLATVTVGLVRLLDRYGLCPKALIDQLPFHTSMFITNNASIGLMKVYHHIYNFGNTSVFVGMGKSNRYNSVDAQGNPIRRCTLPIGITVDERVCGGATYSRFFAVMNKHLKNPELLEVEPEQVFYNNGVEYHVPKPEGVFVPKAREEAAVKA